MVKKLISKERFKQQISNSKVFAIGGFRRSGTPQQLLRLIRESFDQSGNPSKLTLIFSSSPTDPGVDVLAKEGLVDRVIASFYGSIPQLRKLIQENIVSGYSFPQGQIALLFREIARKSPGLISSIGLHSFVDPEFGGGKLNSVTKEDLVEKIKISNKDYLFYKSTPIDAALLRGTFVDKNGNISMRDEPIKTEYLSMAQAAKSSGGKVFIQVLSKINNSLNPNEVDLPAHLIDGVLICDDPENDHRQTNKYLFHSGLVNKISNKVAIDILKENDVLCKQIIARRALKEIEDSKVINLGQGLPELVGAHISQHPNRYNDKLISLESGVLGGIPLRRPDFGVAMGPVGFLTHDNQFVCYNGGQLDMTILSFAQIDQFGNVNVSYFGGENFGCGGFIDILQNTKKIVFIGSFTAKGLEIITNEDKISIKREGKIRKFVSDVDQITYPGKLQIENEQVVKIITERCAFQVTNGELVLTEIAPGIELEKDILSHMDFKPRIAEEILEIK